MDIEYPGPSAHCRAMKHTLAPLALILGLALAAPAGAACYADYKARQDNPLQLHYGVMEITGPCDPAAATDEARKRLGAQGWTLLNVLSVFDDAGLAQRRDTAGAFFLRY